jgi:hypothetical protein
LFRARRATALGIIVCVLTVVLATPLICQRRLAAWSLEPVLRLGSLDGPYAFAALGPVVVSPRTGNVFVDEASQRILAFDSTGKKLSSFGRTGDGPGEFQNLLDIYWSDGQIVAFDAGSSRVSWFTEEGGQIESRRILSTGEMKRIVNRYVPDFFTPVSDVRAGVDGSIWLKRQTEDTDRAWWWVLNGRGDLVARLHLP